MSFLVAMAVGGVEHYFTIVDLVGVVDFPEHYAAIFGNA